MKVATKDALVAFEVVANVQHLDGRLIVCPPHVALEDAHGLTAHDREGMFDPRPSAGDLSVFRFFRFVQPASTHTFICYWVASSESW